MKSCNKVIKPGTWIHAADGKLTCDDCMDYNLKVVHSCTAYSIEVRCGMMVKDADELSLVIIK